MVPKSKTLESPEIKALTKQSLKYKETLSAVLEEMKKEVVGQENAMEELLIALIANGHVLLEGVPGVAKTLMIKTLAQSLRMSFKRIQFTPDLLPADITGTRIYDHQKTNFFTKKGPLFNNFILADEINRAPPKVQSALLEAMQEKQVTIGDETFILSLPFMVFATQNPLETEGTYILPEAQVDRFMCKVLIGYPSKNEEVEVVNRNTQNRKVDIDKVLTQSEILEIQKFVRDIYADETIISYVAELIDATRHPQNYHLDIRKYIDYGASPRAAIWLVLAGKARALLSGRGYVIPEDIRASAPSVLRHRLILSYEAIAEKINSDSLIQTILDKVKSP